MDLLINHHYYLLLLLLLLLLLAGQRLNPRHAGLGGVAAGFAGAYMSLHKSALPALLW